MPLQIIYINFAITAFVVGQGKYFAVFGGFAIIKLWVIYFKQTWLVVTFIVFAFGSITGTDQFFKAKTLKILCKKDLEFKRRLI